MSFNGFSIRKLHFFFYYYFSAANNLTAVSQYDSAFSTEDEYQNDDGSFAVPTSQQSKMSMRKENDESLDITSTFPTNLANSTAVGANDDSITPNDSMMGFESTLNLTDKEKIDKILFKSSDTLDRTIQLSKNDIDFSSIASSSVIEKNELSSTSP